MKRIGALAAVVVRRVAGGKRPGLDRSFAGRFARRLARKQRRNWRENGLRPRGRGYDWARQLIPEELAKRADAAGVVHFTSAELAEAIGCAARTVQAYVKRLARVDQYGRPTSAPNACIRRLEARRGRGGGMVAALNPSAIAELLKWLQTPKSRRFAKASPQLSLPMEETHVIPADIQAIVDRMQQLAAARRGPSPASEDRAKRGAAPIQLASRSKSDLFPHTPQISEFTPSEPAGAGSNRSASRSGMKIPRSVPALSIRPDRKALRTDWLEIAAIDRSESETLSERHRRRLMRHLRLACWNRGLGQVETRRVVGALGWEAQRLRKATHRKYLLIAGVNWVMTASPAVLRGATGHFLGMVKVVRELSSGSDDSPSSAKSDRG